MKTNKTPYIKCPYCGSNTFMVNRRASGYVHVHYNFTDGVDDGNSGMVDGFTGDPLKTVRCSECGKTVGTLNTLK